MDLVLPMLKADFFLADTYQAVTRPLLDIPGTVFNGLKDYDIDEGFCEQWQSHFASPLDFETFDSGHFFINDMREEYLAALNKRLIHIVDTKL